jgi:hypothetical protein
LTPRAAGRVALKEAGSLRLTELLLLLAPFAAFIAWRLSLGAGGPSRLMLIVAACVLALLGGVLVWLSREGAVPPGAAYVPAELQDGRIVPGRAVPR